MKHFYFFVAILVFSAQKINAQRDTKYGTGALANMTVSEAFDNSAFGYNALNKLTTSDQNTAIGSRVLENNTGSYNTGVGSVALWLNSSGLNNSALGYRSLQSNQTGSYNTSTGSEALKWNKIGGYNTATGYQALCFTTGSYNTANGSNALSSNTTGTYNTASGFRSLLNNTTGSYNTAYGVDALYSNTTGENNTAVGIDALSLNTTGFNNTVTGLNVMYNNTTGHDNTATGREALFGNTTGFNNTAIGSYALIDNTTGARNTALGDSAGAKFNSTYSTFIGYKTSVTVTGLTNITVLGNHASATASNQVRIGNTSVTSIGGNVGWTTLSDGRFKRNINEDVPGLTFINKLRPVTYTLDIDGIDKVSGLKEQLTNEEIIAKSVAAKEKHTGFVAQEVEKVANELKYDFGAIDKPKNDKDFYGLRYSEFVVPLVKAIQELSKKNEELIKKNDDLEARLNKLESLLSEKNVSNNTSLAYLEQNRPNPSDGSTIIQYHLPLNAVNGKIVITDIKGSIMKTITVSNNDKGQISLNSGLLSAGTYNYILYLNNKIIDSKQMVITK